MKLYIAFQGQIHNHRLYFCFNTNGFTLLSYSDASGNPVTQQVQSVAVTDASGNPVTGKKKLATFSS